MKQLAIYPEDLFSSKLPKISSRYVRFNKREWERDRNDVLRGHYSSRHVTSHEVKICHSILRSSMSTRSFPLEQIDRLNTVHFATEIFPQVIILLTHPDTGRSLMILFIHWLSAKLEILKMANISHLFGAWLTFHIVLSSNVEGQFYIYRLEECHMNKLIGGWRILTY